MNNPILLCVDRNPFGDIEKLVSVIAGLGFSGMEWHEAGARETWSDPDVAAVIRAAARKNELVCQYHAPYDDAFDLARDEGQLRSPDSVALVLRHALDRAERLGARLVNVHLGTCPPDTDRAEALRTVMEGIRLAVTDLENRRILLALENNADVNFESPLGDRPEDFDWLLANIDSPWVGQTIDIGHANIGDRIDAFLGRSLDRLISMHLHDNLGKTDDHRPFGGGNIAWERVFSRISAACYSGPFVLEFFTEGEGYLRAIDKIRGHN